jgi:hypothetical protein
MSMTLMKEQVFLSEIDRQTRLAVAAADRVNEAFYHLVGDEGGDATLPHRENFWTGFQDVALAVAQISKMLWPTSPRGKVAVQASRVARGERLRALLGIHGENPLESRKCRDHLEHFDERVDAWLGPDKPSFWFDFNIYQGFSEDDPEIKQQVRAISLMESGLCVIVFGEVFSLYPIFEALHDLLGRIPAAMKQPSLDHPRA